MRAVPALKDIREARALSQRDLAKLSGVAHDTIGQIERGERRARPSTVRKLADALGTEPSVLLSLPGAAMGEEDERSRAVVRTQKAGRAEQAAVQEQVGQGRQSSQQWLKELKLIKLEKFEKEKEDWEAAGRWAEYFVSGKAAANDPRYSLLEGQYTKEQEDILTLTAVKESDYLWDSFRLPSATLSEERALAWMKLDSGDPQQILEVTQQALRTVREVIEDLSKKEASYEAVPDHYLEDPDARRRLERLRVDLQQHRKDVIEAAAAMLDLHTGALRALDEQMDKMRKEEDEERDRLEALVRRSNI